MNRQARITARKELTITENSSATERSASKQKPSRKKVKTKQLRGFGFDVVADLVSGGVRREIAILDDNSIVEL